MLNKNKVWDIGEYFLGLVAFFSLFLYLHLNMSSELQDPDVWLHIKTGEYIVQHQSVPYTDIYSSTVPGKEWIDHSWLVQVIFYLVFHFGGPDNLILLSAVTVLLAFLFLFFSIYKRRQYLTLGIIILALTILASRARFNIRPENFSILFFSLYLFLLTRCIHNKWIFLAPLIQLFWVNCHGFFIVGPLLVGVFILAEKLKRSKILPWEWGKAEPLDARSYKNLVLVFLLMCLVSFLNPYGYKGVIYPFSVTFNSIGKLSIFYKYIIELLPTWRLSLNLARSYYVLAIISLFSFLFNFRKINLAHLLAWLIFLGISFRVNRNIIFFNFVAFLTTMNNLVDGLDKKKINFIENFFGKSIYLWKYLILLVVIFWFAQNNNARLQSSYYLFEENRYKSALLGIRGKEYPDKAIDFLSKNELPGNIFNQFNYGSYLIYRLYPKKRVFIDGRTELYGEDFFKKYQKIIYLSEKTINSSFERYDINTVLICGKALDTGNLLIYFFNKPGEWALVYFDEDSVIFLKNTPRNKKLIDKFKIDLKTWQVPKANLNKIGMRRIFPEPYLLRAWMFYFLDLNEQAINEAREALKIQPSSPDAYNIIGRIYIKQKLFDRAFETLRLARIYEPDYKETLISLGSLYKETGKNDKALETYKKLIKLNPYYAEGYYNLGQMYGQMKNLKLAIKSMRSAIKLNPYCVKYY
ncbi:MAG: tetratricopeptide repeat protein, partial [Candidatus Omnitrophica bacterium]|nr:tetratricopeptide repeat protein [Candidatus Omnitrophota bacterium]